MIKSVSKEEAWKGEANCRICTLRDSVLFAGLEEKDFEHIHKPIEQLPLKPGDYLYHAGDKADRMFTIRSGLVKLVQYLPDGSQRIVRLLRATDVTGMEALVGGEYQHDAIIMQNTEVCILPVDVVQRLSQENSALHQELMRRWQQALAEADLWITQLSTGSAKQRVARLLLKLVCDDDNRCELFNREDMGAILGITTETASRTVAEFKRKGLLQETTPNNYIADREKLMAVAEDL
ncbi:MAG TPA: Crp/Fnr family transcriptional regulator [Thiolapillus brandeum]|uniref:Crp/Fnr family transcriptional regulator n=1 Tax=Thiolapillus brandeum TaxID=1076588 RepID=A0A7C5MXH6_9GAMM|nr:Crp/Fnr family transcriptional regulator [Thiolapillus brandeum]